jgi:hypothetical protein
VEISIKLRHHAWTSVRQGIEPASHGAMDATWGQAVERFARAATHMAPQPRRVVSPDEIADDQERNA